MSLPSVSVAIPVYQGARFLEASIRSVLAQSFRDFELVVVDDGSSDGSWEITQRLAGTCGGGVAIRVLRNQTRLGLVGNWNRCIESARGRYILLFHQDDILMPGMLERSVAALEQHPDVGFVYSGFCCIDEDDRPLPAWSTSPFAGRAGGLPVLEALLRENFICCPSVVVPRAVYAGVGPYDRRFAFAPDLEMWFRIASRHDVFCCSDLGVRYRLHSSQATQDFRSRRKVRGDLEYLSAALVGLKARRAEYPELWRALVRDSLWMLRHNARLEPAASLWAMRFLAECPADVLRAAGCALLERSGLRRRRRKPDPAVSTGR